MPGTTSGPPPSPLIDGTARRFADRAQTRLVNPVVRAVLGTPLHDLLSGSLLVLHVTGRKSGTRYRVPARYAREGDGLVLVSRRSRTWWRNLAGGAPVSLTLQGERRTGRATVSAEPARVRTALRAIAQSDGAGHDDGRPPIPVEEAVAITIRLDPPPAPATPPPGHRALWRRWFTAVTLGEIVGFAFPALAAPLIVSLGFGGLAEAATLVLTGVIEGSVLGLAQAYALRTALSAVSTREWVAATAGGAAIAWLIGSLPFVLGDRLLALPPPLLAALGLTLLASMGALQWRVLRRHVAHASRWVAATAASWLVALGAFAAVTTPLWQEGQPSWLIAAIGVLGGAVMAATVAALTGLALVRLLRPSAAAPLER